MKKIIKISLAVIIGILTISQIALASSAVLSVVPTTVSNIVGAPFSVTAQINPVGNDICVVKGTLNLDKLTCQSITLASGVMGQTVPTCEIPNFTLGIPKCTTSLTNLFTISVKGNQAGQASIIFTNVKVIGAGKDVPFGSQSGTYNITALAQNIIDTTTQKITPKTNLIPSGVEKTILVASTSEATTSEDGLPTNTGAVGLAMLTSGYTGLLLLIIIIISVIFGLAYLAKKNKKE